jgi:hypothetical protein
MKGPFMLPGSVMEGDYLEIGMIGGYGRVMATRFNGFGEYDQVVLSDEPMLTLYAEPQPTPVIAPAPIAQARRAAASRAVSKAGSKS